MNPSRLLVFLRDHLGDVVNATGAVHALQTRYPEAHIVVEAGASATELLPTFEVWPRKRGGLAAKLARLKKFREGKFDAAVIFDNSHDYARLSIRAKIPQIYGVHKGRPDLFTATFPYDIEAHDTFPILQGVLEIVDAGPYPGPMLPPLPELPKSGIVACFPGASLIEKEWPSDLWRGLAAELSDLDVRFIPAKEGDEEFPHQEPRRGLLELAAWLKSVDLLITGDTGPAHIAAAVGTPTLILYGPSEPHRFHPWGDKWTALREPNQCQVFHGDGCAEGNPCPRTCMSRLSPEIVSGAARGILGSS